MTEALKIGDIVAEKHPASYCTVLGVVERIARGRLYVCYGGVEVHTFSAATGISTNTRCRAAGWKVVPLDANVRTDILNIGFAIGPCSRRELERMEAAARKLRDILLNEATV